MRALQADVAASEAPLLHLRPLRLLQGPPLPEVQAALAGGQPPVEDARQKSGVRQGHVVSLFGQRDEALGSERRPPGDWDFQITGRPPVQNGGFLLKGSGSVRFGCVWEWNRGSYIMWASSGL